MRAFGDLRPLRPLSGGHRNAVWLVEDRGKGKGGLFVAKSTRRSEAQLRWLAPVMAAATAAGWITAPLIAAPDGRLAPEGVTLEPYLDGRAPDDPAELAGLAPALRPRLEAFHAATRHLPQRPGFLAATDLVHADRGGDADLSALPRPLVAACRAAWAALDTAQTAIHGDLSPGNLRLTDAGPALIDWDEARRDHPAFDAIALRAPSAIEGRAHLAWEVAVCWQAEPARARALAVRLTGAPPP